MENPNPDNADLEDTNSDEVEQAVIDSTHSYGPWPWVFLGCFFITIVGVVAYLVGTADVRLRESMARLQQEKKEADAKAERLATESLIRLAEREASSLSTTDRGPSMAFPFIRSLNGGSWAREKFNVDKPEWELKRSESAGYPFDGTVRIHYYRFATLYQESKELAEKDEDFYLTDGDSFYRRPDPTIPPRTEWGKVPVPVYVKPDPGTYSSGRKTTLTIQLVYDPDSGWKERSRKTTLASDIMQNLFPKKD